MFRINLLLLGFIIGVELSLGVMVAPIIFNANTYLKDDILNLLQSGILMGQIFVKFGYALIFVSSFSFLYELYCLFKLKDNIKIKISRFLLSSIILALSLLFVFYFTAYVLDAQSLGEEATKTEEFIKIHGASEVVMKIIMFSQVILFFLNFKTKKMV